MSQNVSDQVCAVRPRGPIGDEAAAYEELVSSLECEVSYLFDDLHPVLRSSSPGEARPDIAPWDAPHARELQGLNVRLDNAIISLRQLRLRIAL